MEHTRDRDRDRRRLPGSGWGAGTAAAPRNASDKLGAGKLPPPPPRNEAATRSTNMSPKREKLHMKGYIVNTGMSYNSGGKKMNRQSVDADLNLRGVGPVTLTQERCVAANTKRAKYCSHYYCFHFHVCANTRGLQVRVVFVCVWAPMCVGARACGGLRSLSVTALDHSLCSVLPSKPGTCGDVWSGQPACSVEYGLESRAGQDRWQALVRFRDQDSR